MVYIYCMYNAVLTYLQICAPCGVVFVYHLPDDIEPELTDLLTDPNIRCVQCDSFHDKLNLHDKLHINGEVDLCHLVRLYLDCGSKSGIGAIAEEMGEHRINFWDGFYNHRKYGQGKLDTESMVHAVQVGAAVHIF